MKKDLAFSKKKIHCILLSLPCNREWEGDAHLEQTPSLTEGQRRKRNPRRWFSEAPPEACAQRYAPKYHNIIWLLKWLMLSSISKKKKALPFLNANTFPFLHLKATCDFQPASTNRLTDNIPRKCLLCHQVSALFPFPLWSKPVTLHLCRYTWVAYLFTCCWAEQTSLHPFLVMHS